MYERNGMQPMDMVAPDLGGMPAVHAAEQSRTAARKPARKGGSGDALVFIAMGLVSSALGLGLYAHLGTQLPVAILAALMLFISTSFLHVFVRRMQGVDLLDRRVSALEQHVTELDDAVHQGDVTPADRSVPDFDAVEFAPQIDQPGVQTRPQPAKPHSFAEPAASPALAQDGLDALAAEIAEARLTPRLDAEAISAGPSEREFASHTAQGKAGQQDLPEPYAIPRDAGGVFASGRDASPYDAISATRGDDDALRFGANDERDMVPPAAVSFEPASPRPAPTESRSIDGLVQELAVGMGARRSAEPNAANAESSEETIAISGDTRNQSHRQSGETSLIAMPDLDPVPASAAPTGPIDLSEFGAPRTLDPIAEGIREASKARRIEIYLQPILSINDRKVRFFEVLGRIKQADGNVLAAEDHADAIRDAQVTVSLDHLVMVRAARLLRKLAERQQAQPLFCNLSREALQDAGFVTDLAKAANGLRDVAPYMIIEVDHASVTSGDPAIRAALRQFAGLGFRISIDKVHNAEQAIANGREIDAAFIKLPYAAFFDAGLNEADARARAATIQSVARDSGQTIIVDRIERRDQLSKVVSVGTNLGQGYLFSEPKPLLPQVAAEVAEESAAA
ncbi:MAG: EAL domain-containing protein [Pseudomonadota bacterium]